MPYPSLAVVVMVGIGIGALLYYVFSEPGQPAQSCEYSNSHTSSSMRRLSSRRSSNRDGSTSDDIKCSICLSEGPNLMRIRPCGHTFHRDCITSWRIHGPNAARNSCPVCRRIINTAMA